MTKTKLLTGAALIAVASCTAQAAEIDMFESMIAQNPLSSSTLVDMTSKTVGGWTLDELTEMGTFSDLSYYSRKNANSRHMQTITRLEEEGNKVHFFRTARENSGLIIEKADGEIIIAYHGTKSRANLATDLWGNRCLMEEMEGGAHNGFYNGFQQTIDQIMKKLNKIAKQRNVELKDLRIRTTGHSMGAALAGLFAKYLDEVHSVSNLKAALFACPMFLDSVGAKDYQNRKIGKNTIVVIEDSSDPVPHMDGHLAVAGFGLFGAAVAGPVGLGLGAIAYPLSFFGNHIGEILYVDKPEEHYVHSMGGYNKAIGDMKKKMDEKRASKAIPPKNIDAQTNSPEEAQVTETTVTQVSTPKEAEVKDTKKHKKFKATTIVKSSAAKLRDGFHEMFVYPTHKVAKTVKDGVRDGIRGIMVK